MHDLKIIELYFYVETSFDPGIAGWVSKEHTGCDLEDLNTWK